MIRFGICLLCGFMAPCSYAFNDDSPKPSTALRVGENRVTYSQRYDEWLQTIPEEDRAWSLLNSVAGDAENLEHPSTELVERLHAILEYPVLGMPMDELGVSPDDNPEDTELLLGLLLPHIGLLRINSELLVADCEAVDRPDRLLMNLRALQQIQQYTSIADTLIEGIVLIKLDTQMFSMVLNDALDLEAWNQASLDELAFIFAAPSAWEPALRYIQSEQAMQANFLDWIYVNSDGQQLTLEGAKRLLSLAEQAEPSELMIELVAKSVDPRSDQEQVFEQQRQAVRSDLTGPIHSKAFFASIRESESGFFHPHRSGMAYMPVGLMLPAYDRFAVRVHEARVVRDATRLMIAAHRHRAHHGELPQATTEVDRELLPDLPLDPYSGEPLKMRVDDGRVVIYSVGPDQDDDQGRELKDHRFVLREEYDSLNEDEKKYWDGDWVLTDTP